MKTLKHHIRFAPHRKNAEAGPQLQMRVRWTGGEASLSTGLPVDPDKWDRVKQRCESGSFHGARQVPASTINAEVVRFTDAAEEVFAGFAGRDTAPSSLEVREKLRAALFVGASRQTETPLQAFDRFCHEQGAKNAWTATTQGKWRVVRGHLTRWRESPEWEDFDESGLVSLTNYYRDDRGYRNSTLAKQLEFVRWFLRWADGQGLPVPAAWKDFKPRMKGKDLKPVIFLTWGELMQVWDWAPQDGQEHLEKIRDIFCFCCFTGLRFSDAMNLRWPSVGSDSISVATVKTAEPLEIQLNKWSTEILSRYIESNFDGQRVFPSVTNQVYNRELHELCRLAGVCSPVRLVWYIGSERHEQTRPKYELLSSHAGRRTFICNALALGIAPTVVMQWTGHSDYDAMKPYIAVTEHTKKAAMSLFDGLPEHKKGDPKTP